MGHLVFIPIDIPYTAVIVLDLPDLGMMPCLSDVYYTAEVGKRLKDQRTVMFCRSMDIAEFSSKAASWGDIHGHLLVRGPNNFKGRVVDDEMHHSLTVAGSLRVGKHSIEAFYTLPRPFCIDEQHLKDNAFVLVTTASGIPKICAIGRDVKKMIKFGHSAIEGRLNVHKSLKDALKALVVASKLPPPSIDDILLQVSIGGDPKSTLNVGKFLTCSLQSGEPDIAVRCACGFVVDGIANGTELLKRVCTRIRKRKR